uniref:Hexose transporter 1 n=1 Tax=Rhizochromulina marina TaxID=1034831 RepID=A0A7S2RIC0_9STRA|mmetsp:Transcript_16749/g.48803  ORF Transcript_16749/g.48803 Transcript_16749/m.48803 type:complete len:501 (+) Transcript_16749:61-1563(+)
MAGRWPSASWTLICLTGLSALGGFLFGYDTGVVSGAEVFMKNDQQLGLSDLEIELVVSVTVGAAALATAVSGFPMQVYGRKPIIMVACVAYTCGSLAVALAKGLGLLLLGRSLLGVGVGLSSMSTPIYLAEMAPSEIRGMLVACFNLNIVLGQLVACLVNMACTTIGDDDLRWRVSMGIAAVPAVIQFAGFLALPESPRWLAQNGRIHSAVKVLRSLRGAGTSEEQLQEDIQALGELPQDDIGDLASVIRDIRSKVHYQRIFRLGMGLMAFQQLTGINTIMYYGGDILERTGFADSSSVALTAVLAAAQGLGILISIPLFDRYGRRPLILCSTVGVVVSLVVVGLSFLGGVENKVCQATALTGLLGYLVSFGVGLSPGPWIVNAEIYPLSVRGVGNSAATTVNWLFNFAISASFLTIVNSVGIGASFLGFAAIGVVGFMLLLRHLPETSGRSLEDIELLFRVSRNDTGQWASFGREDYTTAGWRADLIEDEDDERRPLDK